MSITTIVLVLVQQVWIKWWPRLSWCYVYVCACLYDLPVCPILFASTRGGVLITLMAGEQVLGVSLLVGATCGGSLSLAPTRGFAAVSVGVAHSHDTWQKPTRSAVRLAKHLLSALTKVVFATSKVMLHVAARRSMARKML